VRVSGNRTRSPARGERPVSIDGWTTGSSSRIEVRGAMPTMTGAGGEWFAGTG
jgi:hypothetical protein